MEQVQQNSKQILLVIPCFNEAMRLQLDAFVQFSVKNPNVHFLFVDDGSTDNTASVLHQLSDKIENASCLLLKNNSGKGEAIRAGVLSQVQNAKAFHFIGYLDADLAIPLTEIHNFIQAINANEELKFLLGSRVQRFGSDINRKVRRHYLGRIFATLVSLILKEKVYDSQCGIKLIEFEKAKVIFKDAFNSKWFFDVELLLRYKVAYPEQMKQVLEIPLFKWTEVKGSKLKTSDFIIAPFDLVRLWRLYRNAL